LRGGPERDDPVADNRIVVEPHVRRQPRRPARWALRARREQDAEFVPRRRHDERLDQLARGAVAGFNLHVVAARVDGFPAVDVAFSKYGIHEFRQRAQRHGPGVELDQAVRVVAAQLDEES